MQRHIASGHFLDAPGGSGVRVFAVGVGEEIT